jgi:demethylmenaquinone methyltransferase/2-methoxy-6-polyprenyl-1,4-benzoquinol methylase
LDKQPRDVAAMFDGVARRYDRTNDVLSIGQARQWRAAVVRAVRPRPGERILDLAAGTGTSSAPFARAGAEVVACDFSLGMLDVGRRTQPDLAFVAGDALRLPFADATFDAVTISFGLRNVHDPEAGLRDMLRVTKPGGRLVVCEFSHPTWSPFRRVYLEYLVRALPAIAERVSSAPDAYVYLAESIRAWPDQAGLSRRLQDAGWVRVGWRNLTGGVVALHRGFAPGAVGDGAGVDDPRRRSIPMGDSDKVGNKIEDLAGKAKEATGRATDNERLEAEGRTDQSKSDLKQAGEKIKDAFK